MENFIDRESLLAGVGDAVAWKYAHIQSGYTDIRVEAPEQMNEWNDMQLWNVEPLYTADQMAAAVAIERERCAKVCDVTALTHEQGDDAATGSYRCAEAIRGQR